MIRQIGFLKGERGWVNFPHGAIKPVVVNGNEVINVWFCQAEGLWDGTRTSMGEKYHICAFVIMQQVSEQGSAISAHGDTDTPVGKHDRQPECTHCPGESGAFS